MRIWGSDVKLTHLIRTEEVTNASICHFLQQSCHPTAILVPLLPELEIDVHSEVGSIFVDPCKCSAPSKLSKPSAEAWNPPLL